MRCSPFVRPAALVVGAAAVLSIFASIILPSNAAVAPPTKPKTTRPAKPPKLAGQVVESEALDMRLVIPEQWKSAPPTPSDQLRETINSPIYFDANRVQEVTSTGQKTSYNPPQFYIICKDVSKDVAENAISESMQDEMVRAIVEQSNKETKNFRYEGDRRVKVNNEPAVAFAAVVTMKYTEDLMRFRIVSMYRNKRIYMFVFAAPLDEFPRFDSFFGKVLQNFQFMTPRKRDVPPPPAPEVEPVKKEGTL